MVGTSTSGSDQLVADGARKRKIREGAAWATGVHMADFPASVTKINTAEAMLGGVHPGHDPTSATNASRTAVP